MEYKGTKGLSCLDSKESKIPLNNIDKIKLCERTKDMMSNIIEYVAERWSWCFEDKLPLNFFDEEWSLNIIIIPISCEDKFIILKEDFIAQKQSFVLNKFSITKGLALMINNYPKDIERLYKFYNYKFLQKRYYSYDEQKFCEDHGDDILNVFFQIAIFGYIKYSNSVMLITKGEL